MVTSHQTAVSGLLLAVLGVVSFLGHHTKQPLKICKDLRVKTVTATSVFGSRLGISGWRLGRGTVSNPISRGVEGKYDGAICRDNVPSTSGEGRWGKGGPGFFFESLNNGSF